MEYDIQFGYISWHSIPYCRNFQQISFRAVNFNCCDTSNPGGMAFAFSGALWPQCISCDGKRWQYAKESQAGVKSVNLLINLHDSQLLYKTITFSEIWWEEPFFISLTSTSFEKWVNKLWNKQKNYVNKDIVVQSDYVHCIKYINELYYACS